MSCFELWWNQVQHSLVWKSNADLILAQKSQSERTYKITMCVINANKADYLLWVIIINLTD